MRRSIYQVTQFAILVAVLSMVWPAPAQAQRHLRARAHRTLFVHAAYGGPYFYYPGFYYPGFAGPFAWYGYPWGPWGPWPAYGYYDATSSVRIQGAPREAEVYVDGYYAGTVDDFDGIFQRLRLPPGEHEIVIYLEGYRSTKQNILFRPGAGYRIDARLDKLPEGAAAEPRPAPTPDTNPPNAVPSRRGRPGPSRGAEMDASPEASGFGTLAVRVRPAGASVLVDGERWEGPAAGADRLLVQLAEGRHRVEVRSDGYQPYATEIEVRSGQTVTLNVSLPQEPR